MAVPTYCGNCLRSIGSATDAQNSFTLLKNHTPNCPANIAEGGKNIPSTLLQELNPFFPLWTAVTALF